MNANALVCLVFAKDREVLLIYTRFCAACLLKDGSRMSLPCTTRMIQTHEMFL